MIRRGEELAAACLESTRALVVIVAADNRIVLANPALEAFTGIPAVELEGRFFHDVYVVPEHRLLAQDAVARSMETGVAYPQEGDWLAAGGVRRRIAMQIDVLRDGDGRPWALACVGVDVTAEREREARLHRRAQTDLLTGLFNRSALFEELQRQLDPPPVRAAGWSSATWTGSRRSTTGTGTRWGTRCSSRWRGGSPRWPGPPTWRPGSVATSSSCSAAAATGPG